MVLLQLSSFLIKNFFLYKGKVFFNVKSIMSSLIVLNTCITQVEDLSIATVARSHPWLELRIIILTTVSFIISHTDPRLLYIFIQFKLQSPDADSYSNCIICCHIWLVIGNPWYNRFGFDFSICFLYDCFLNCMFCDTDRLCRLRLSTGCCSHV